VLSIYLFLFVVYLSPFVVFLLLTNPPDRECLACCAWTNCAALRLTMIVYILLEWETGEGVGREKTKSHIWIYCAWWRCSYFNCILVQSRKHLLAYSGKQKCRCPWVISLYSCLGSVVCKSLLAILQKCIGTKLCGQSRQTGCFNVVGMGFMGTGSLESFLCCCMLCASAAYFMTNFLDNTYKCRVLWIGWWNYGHQSLGLP
jgi:hypothetical protein